jgi:hypothetical protein
MSQFHLCGLGLVDEGGQRPAASTTSTSRMLTAGPRDTEIAAAILAGAAATFQRGRQRARAICRTIVANRRLRGSLGLGA